MTPLTPDNAVARLRSLGVLTPSPASAEALSGGVSNVVLRVTQGDTRLIVKQSCPQLRTKAAWFSDVDRVFREIDVQALLHDLIPDSVPGVAFADRDNFAYGMAHAPDPATPWKASLLAGDVDVGRGAQAGRLLGRIHRLTSHGGLDRFADRRVFVQLRVEPFYDSVKRAHPDLAAFIDPLVADMANATTCLCHGDFSPKNLLQHPAGLTLVDHETAHLGDPAMDVGFFFSHLMLKRLRARGTPRYEIFTRLVRTAWEAYEGEYPGAADLSPRGLAHLGVCVTARIDGTSPIDYLDESGRAAARAFGRAVLTRRARSWDEAFRVDGELSEG